MSDLSATRTLVKSAPELWAQCSDPDSLARHLHAFGEIRITRLEPERAVVWEGERARGTVLIESSGWGTKVTLTAAPQAGVTAAAPAAAPAPAPAPAAAVAPAPAERRRGLLGWLTGRRGSSPPEPQPVAQLPSEPATAAVPSVPVDAPAALDAALESLGQAHHRPFSRT